MLIKTISKLVSEHAFIPATLHVSYAEMPRQCSTIDD